MAANNEVVWEVLNYLRVYKDGHIERLAHPGPDFIHATYDPINGVSSKDITIDPNTGVSARLYLPKQVESQPEKKFPVLVYYHGGGFCLGSAFSSWNQNYLNSLSSKANIIIVSVEYRLAPEHPLPTGYEDSWQALQWVVSQTNNNNNDDDDAWLQNHADFGRVFVSGDSAGGNIAHHMVMKIGSSERMKVIKGMVLVHPYFWGVERLECEIPKAGIESSKVLTVDGLDKMWPNVCHGTSGNDDARINPFAEGAPSLAGLGCEKVMVCVAGKDLLRDRGRIYYEKLKSSGWKGMAEILESHGEDHCFHLFDLGCDKALEMMKRLVDFFN